jgi:hypothetical protein
LSTTIRASPARSFRQFFDAHGQSLKLQVFVFLRADCVIAAFDTHREADLLPASEVTRRLRD